MPTSANANTTNENLLIDQQMSVSRGSLAPITRLVVSGGGFAAIEIMGTLRGLELLGYLRNINEYAGTSAGAIIATMLALGYSTTEMMQMICEHKPFDLFRFEFNQIWNLGLCSGDQLMEFFSRMIYQKTGSSRCTFRWLHDRGKRLVVTGTNVSTRQLHYFESADMELRVALRISCGIPFMFTPYLYETNYYIDGGWMNNYPINVFPQQGTLGIRVKEQPGKSFEKTYSSYLRQLILCVTDAEVHDVREADEIVILPNNIRSMEVYIPDVVKETIWNDHTLANNYHRVKTAPSRTQTHKDEACAEAYAEACAEEACAEAYAESCADACGEENADGSGVSDWEKKENDKEPVINEQQADNKFCIDEQCERNENESTFDCNDTLLVAKCHQVVESDDEAHKAHDADEAHDAHKADEAHDADEAHKAHEAHDADEAQHAASAEVVDKRQNSV